MDLNIGNNLKTNITVFNKILFQYHLAGRMLTIMTRKSKSIKLRYFEHYKSADEKFVIIKHRFTNAVIYEINGNKTLSRTITLKKYDVEQQVNFTVYGFFRKKEYMLNLNEDDAYFVRLVKNTHQRTSNDFAVTG